MACPYFFPVAPDANRSSMTHATLPLGDAWSGLCHAIPGDPREPATETLYPTCNIGYARGRCPRFPAGDGPDAVRFSISADDGASVRLYYVVERDHLPFAHGPLEYAIAEEAFRQSPEPAAVARLAGAYVSSYLRRKREASAR